MRSHPIFNLIPSVRKNEKNSLFFHSVNTFFVSLGPILSVYFLLKNNSIDAWGSLALGQAIGLFTSIFVSLGTGVDGASEIAQHSRQHQKILFLRMSIIQIFILLPASTLSFVIAYICSNSHKIFAGLGSVSVNILALTFSWYFFGKGEPKKLVLYETFPRTVISLLSIILFEITKNFYALITVQIILNFFLYLSGIVIFYRNSAKDLSGILKENRIIQSKIRVQPIFIALLSSFNSILPILVVSLTVNNVLPAWAILDKLTRYFSIANEPITNRFRNLTKSNDKPRIKQLLFSNLFIYHLISGTFLSFSMFIFGSRIISAISSENIQIQNSSILFVSVALFINLSFRNPLYLSLVSRNGLFRIILGLSLTFVISGPLIFFLGQNYFLTGVSFGFFLISLFNVLTYLILLTRYTKSG
jgi:O-antigen/teichoic acid export membrane protein